MSLTVEDGTGLADADALISLAYADAYHSARGNATWTGTDTAKEQAIRRASTYMSEAFRWQGYKARNRLQALAWPRSSVYDEEGIGIPADEVPDKVQRATAEIALRELVTPGSMTPDYTASERVKSETVGPLSVTYDMSRTDADSARPVLLILRGMIGPLLAKGAGNRLVGGSYRG